MSGSIALFFFLFVLPLVDSLAFNFPVFKPDDPNMAYQGDAIPKGFVEFSDVDYVSRAGWATYAGKVPIWDPSTGKASDFSTNFSFRIDTHNRTNYAAGFVFFLAPVGVQFPLNSAGGFLGLFNRTNVRSSLYPLVHIEFDTFNNPEWDPTNVDTHVGINNNSLVSSSYTSWNASSHSQDIGHVKIMYDSATENLSVSWTYKLTSDPRENSSLFYKIDLAKVLPPLVTVGFSAATSYYMEGHRLLSWEFSSNMDVKDRKDNTNRKGIVVSVSVTGFVLLTFVLVTIMVVRKRKQRKKKARETTNSRSSMYEELEWGAGPKRFAYKDLMSTTNNFLDGRKLGEGGFGAVYKGYLNDLDMMVAVKKLSTSSRQGNKEFITEVKIVSRLRHRNLVQLVGWCHEKDELLLVYEFMPNGSLDSYLFGSRTHLEWSIRYKISLGLASGLGYLHEEWEQCVVHRDIKASNILLDSNFNAKLGDFGLARSIDHEMGPLTTTLAGTFGYMAPEYISTGRASKESDVYSFGIVVLELVTGRKSVEPSRGRIEPERSLVEKVWDLYGKGELVSAIDEKLSLNFDCQQAECVMTVGLWCAHPDSNSRPSIRQAIQVLNFEAALPDLPLRMPVASYHVSPSSASIRSAGGSITISSAQVGR